MKDYLAPAGTWVKSTYSSNEGQCIEVANFGDSHGVRDSKDPSGPSLWFGASVWSAFTAGVQAGQFD